MLIAGIGVTIAGLAVLLLLILIILIRRKVRELKDTEITHSEPRNGFSSLHVQKCQEGKLILLLSLIYTSERSILGLPCNVLIKKIYDIKHNFFWCILIVSHPSKFLKYHIYTSKVWNIMYPPCRIHILLEIPSLEGPFEYQMHISRTFFILIRSFLRISIKYRGSLWIFNFYRTYIFIDLLRGMYVILIFCFVYLNNSILSMRN